MRSKDPQSKDKIQCQLCGKWFYLISWQHLLAKHNITSSEYKEAFEINYLWSEASRNARRKWTKEKIIEEIRRRYRNGEPLNYRHINRKNNWLCVTAAKKYFKNWKDAVEAAGIDYEKISLKQSWNHQNIIETIIRLKKEGHPIYNAYIHRLSPNLYVGARFCFGGWRQAVEAAGIKYELKKKQSRWTKEKVIAKLQEMKSRGGKTNRTYFRKNYPGLESAMIRIFKDWNNALPEAGIKQETQWFNPPIPKVLEIIIDYTKGYLKSRTRCSRGTQEGLVLDCLEVIFWVAQKRILKSKWTCFSI